MHGLRLSHALLYRLILPLSFLDEVQELLAHQNDAFGVILVLQALRSYFCERAELKSRKGLVTVLSKSWSCLVLQEELEAKSVYSEDIAERNRSNLKLLDYCLWGRAAFTTVGHYAR